jgi:uncharacterized protein
MRKPARVLTLTAWLLGAAGCTIMAPQPDRTQYFVLSPVAASSSSVAPASTASTAHLSIGVGPIKFPDYLKRPWVVTRAASNRVMVSDFKRWAESLDKNFEGTLGQNLAQMLGTRKIVYYPWYADAHVDYQVEVWVSNFETSEGGASSLSAVWIIANPKDGTELAGGQASASAPVQPGDDGPSAALSTDLAEMSRQVADRIAELNSMKPSAALNSARRPHRG